MTAGSAPRARALAATAIAALVGCGGDAGSGPPPSLQALTLDTLFTVGAESGREWEVFGGIWDVEASPDGHLAVLDVEAPAVHVFDASGAHVGSILATGLDEGAIDSPSGIAWDGNRDLLVWDPGSSWISRFSVGGTGVAFADRRRAFAFGETGFCSHRGRTYLSYWQDDLVVHEIGSEGPARSFASMPTIPGVETLGPELQEIAIEELTPAGLLCTSAGVLDVSFFTAQMRLHDFDGGLVWSRELEAFHPLSVYTPDGMGLGRRFDPTDGSHLLRSVASWGDDFALVQHELRTQEFPEEGEVDVIESRLVSLSDGTERDRTRALPLILAARGTRLFSVRTTPFPQVIVLEVSGQG